MTDGPIKPRIAPMTYNARGKSSAYLDLDAQPYHRPGSMHDAAEWSAAGDLCAGDYGVEFEE